MKNLILIIPFALSLQLNAQIFKPQSTTGKTPPAGIDLIGHISDVKNVTIQQIIPGVPAYLWQHGCGPTAVGMVMGYYDTHGFPDLILGDASTQTTDVNSAIASTEHYNDYSAPEDYYPNLISDLSELPVGDEHPNNCIADYMYTSQSVYGNYYGWSWGSDIGPAWIDFIYNETVSYYGFSSSYYFTLFPFDSVVSNINRNHPFVVLVDTDGNGSTDHFVCVAGYKTDLGVNYYGCYDTWDNNIHWYEYRQMGTGINWGVYGANTFDISTSNSIDETVFNNNLNISAYPNPFSERINVQFTIVEDDSYKLFVTDITGKIVKRLKDEIMKVGKYNLEYSNLDLSNGCYFVCLESKKSKIAKKISLIK